MNSPTPDSDVVLLIDPDAEYGDSVRESLAQAKLELVVLGSLAETIEWTSRNLPRLVLAELALPDGSGFALCRLFRESRTLKDVPIVLMGRWTHENDRILAFECGADDFLPKPFFERELASRIRAVLRRSKSTVTHQDTAQPTKGISLLHIDEERREARFGRESLSLTPREFSLLATLARHRGRVLSRTDLISEAWRPGEDPTERSVDAHVKSLRRKLGQARNAIETVRGLGYRYSESAVPEPAPGR